MQKIHIAWLEVKLQLCTSRPSVRSAKFIVKKHNVIIE